MFANDILFSRVIVNHVIFIYVKILIYTCKMSLFALLIDPSARKLYGSMSIWHVEVSGHIQIRCTLLVNESWFTIAVVHGINLTLKHADIWKSHVPTGLLIIVNSIAWYYIMWFWHVEGCRQTWIRLRYTWINSSTTEAHYMMLLQHMEQYRHTHVWDTIPQLTRVVQNTSIACQFQML